MTTQAPKNKKKSKIILGIDPGTVVLGYGIVKITGSKVELLQLGVLKLAKYGDHHQRLSKIYERLAQVVDEYKPDEMALEAPFFGKNVQSMLKLGRAQGVAMATALAQGIPVFEYEPRKIKQVITGNGAATKEQVAKILEASLKFDSSAVMLDATDAVGVAICHHYCTAASALRPAMTTANAAAKSGKKSKTNWDSFVSKNPDRLK